MTSYVHIRSYFTLPTDLAGAMRHWPEFVTGDGYSVDLSSGASNEHVEVRHVELTDDRYVTVSANLPGPLFERVLGTVVYALAAHSDDVLVQRLS
jgi:hypothetical protein